MNVIELRAEADGSPGLRVLASRTDAPYPVGNMFTETIRPGAFTQSLSRGDLDVVLRVEHDSRDVLARTPLTLRLEETREGLVGHATGDGEDPLWKQTIRRVERGVLKEASFAFKVRPGGDSWNEDRTRREVRTVDLHRGDLALTVYGSNHDTGATVTRSAEQRREVAAAVSRSGLCGPAVTVELRQRPAKMTCADCGGSGDCPTCDGSGWVDGEDYQNNSSRSRRGVVLASNDTAALRAQLRQRPVPRSRPKSQWKIAVEQEEGIRRFQRECRERDERAWAANPAWTERERLLDDYARLVS